MWPWSAFEVSDSYFLFLLTGDKVLNKFKYESGIHRVQRVPPTESKGRRHTSSIAVSVLPYKEIELYKFNDKDFVIKCFVGSGPGGQHRNKTESNVEITHIKSGLSAKAGSRSQYKNKIIAFNLLLDKLSEKNIEIQNKELNDERRSQIKNMGRGAKVRTYNFIRGLVSDERCKKEFQTDKIMKGNLELIYNEIR